MMTLKSERAVMAWRWWRVVVVLTWWLGACVAASDAGVRGENASSVMTSEASAEACVEREADLVTVACVTWNMAALCPRPRDCKFLESLRHHSVICVGVQELEDLKPRRQEGHRSVRWTETLRRAFPPREFLRVADHAAGPVRLAVFVKKSAPVKVRSCSVADVACGIGNIVRNKGCSAAFLELSLPTGAAADAESPPTKRARAQHAVRLVVVAAHLAAHAHKVDDRNADYWRVCRELYAALPEAWKPRRSADVIDFAGDENIGRAQLLDVADLVLFSGDLNYRLDLPREEAERGALAHRIEDLLTFDQLLRQRAKRVAFAGLSEGQITFDPTFKFDKRSDSYDSSKKMRVPSWTDRILYTPRAQTKRHGRRPMLIQTSYDAVQSAKHSDHRPVVATFKLKPGNDVETHLPGTLRVAPAPLAPPKASSP